ncbi:hypothetical protein BDR07DRAFT_1607298 [Suillus spraguei]|nr:hypothetical protein BDR07DRAFT_1607298 [Suillus spraguei]
MSMSSDSSSPITGSLSSTFESDTNEPSDDSSVYSDPSSLSTVSRLDSSTDWDTESESAGSNPDSGTEADDELNASAPTAEAQLGQPVNEFIRDSYSHRYQMARNQLPRGTSQMRHSLRVSPYTFDQICTKLASDPVFTNNSQNQQILLADQLAVALYRFGHDGNGTSTQTVVDCVGLGLAKEP